MAGARDIRAGRAFIEVGAQDKFTSVLNKIAARFASVGTVIAKAGLGLTAIGTSILAPLGAASKLFADMGSEIYDASIRTGVAAEQLSGLKYAAEQAGSSLGEVESGLKKMAKVIASAREGSKEATDALNDLGVSVETLQGLSPDKQFRILGEQLNNVADATKKAALAQELFGKNAGTQLLPMLENGAAGLDAMQKRAEELGIVITGEAATAADAFGDSLADLWKQAKAVAFWVGSAVASALQPYADATTRILRTTIEWVKANKGLIVTVAAIAAGVALAGVGLTALGVTFISIGAVLSGIAAGVGVFGTALAAIVSPIGLVVVALGGLAAYFLFATETGGQAIDWLVGKFYMLAGEAKSAFKGISDALAAGDLRLAAQILWAGLKLEWTRGIGFLSVAWANFKGFFLKTANDIFYGAQAAWEIVQGSLERGWIQAAAFFSRTFITAVSAVAKIWEKTQNVLAKGWIDVMGVFDPKLDTKAAKESLDKQSQQNLANIDKETNAKLSATEQAQQAQLAAAKKQHEANLAGIAGQNKAENDAVNQETKKKEDAAAAELKAAQDQLAALNQQAAKQRESLPGGGPSGLPTLPDLGGMAEKLSTAVASRGTFNAAAVQSLQSDATQERIAKGVEESARTLRQIKSGQPAFT